MEWVETTAKTIEAAKEAALDRLGVDAQEAEFEVIDDAETGWFGRVKSEARVRARVKPVAPRPKPERRDRNNNRKRGKGRDDGRGNRSQSSGGNKGRGGAERSNEKSGHTSGRHDSAGQGSGGQGRTRGGQRAAGAAAGGAAAQGQQSQQGQQGQEGRQGQQANRSDNSDKGKQKRNRGNTNVQNQSDMSIADQADVAKGFLEGLVQSMGLEGTVAVENVMDDEATAQVSGAELGLLVGPGGRTLDALHELSRTVIQRHAGGSPNGRIRIDVGGYRERRKAALQKFVTDLASKVLESGDAQSLEPMGSADRKIAHDTVGDIDGVSTISEGEDPNRRVVIVPGS